ncbi:protein FAM136A-like [Ctenocephalides felis]|uniref:protein FAM136A-like n=1 Tax=Ctenocephalides felis TaxID=7515 RepID=UPI000E6E25F1|nr:protein FAM136A-like [Ctenocephalides felis]
MDEQRQRIEYEITKMVDEMDKEYLRKIQADMHRCAAKCCEDKDSSLSSVQSCVERCSGPLNKAQQYVQGELEGFQGRLQRCVMQCNDDIKDMMGPTPSDKDVDKFTHKFESCAIKCVDKHIELLPQMMKAMKHVLSKEQIN